MNELDFKVLTEKRLLIVPDQTEGIMVTTPIDQTLRAALKVELAKNFGIQLKFDGGITAEFVMDFFRWLKDRDMLITQPYFPRLLPVDPRLEVTDIIRKPAKIASTITYGCFLKEVMSNRRPDHIELLWLEKEMKDDNGPTKVLAGFLSYYLIEGKIKAGRKERKLFMEVLDSVRNLYHYSLDMVDLWKKVALWIHPSDYPEFPHAKSFLFHVLNLKDNRKQPEKPRLRKLMWKGWKEGKDFDVFESYIDQKELTPRDLLISLRDYERCPRVSRWKKTEGVELGREKTGEEETEVVDLMLLQLKEKLLGMLKPIKANLKIPDSFYKIPAHSILKHPLVIAGGVLPDEVKSFRITASKNVHLITYNLDGLESRDREWDHLEDCLDFFIVGYQMAGWNRTKLSITFAGKKGETIGRSEIGVNEEVRSLILFGYESSSHTLRWIGEPSKTFYAGKPSGITDWKNVWKVCMKRKPILSLGEMAEKMYDNVENPTEELTAERIRIDLGL